MLALAIAPAASACADRRSRPVGYVKRLEFTRHGPVVIHVLIAPKPGGLYSSSRCSNSVVPGRETVSQMQQRLSPTTTAAGINGDFADAGSERNLSRGRRLQEQVERGPLVDRNRQRGQPRRPALRPALDLAGLEPAARVGRNQPHARAERGHHLYAVVGRGHAAGDEDDRVDRDPLPASDRRRRAAGAGGAGERERRRHAGPPNGAVLVGRGGQGSRLAQEAGPGVNVNVRLVPHPPWTARSRMRSAVGRNSSVTAGRCSAPVKSSPPTSFRPAGARRCGSAPGRRDRDGGRRRRPRRLQRRHDELRARAGAGPPRVPDGRRPRGRPGDRNGVRRHAAQPPVGRGRATGLGGPVRPLPRRAGARSAAARALAEQGRDRRAPALPLQAPAGGGGRGAPDRPRRWDPLLGELHQGPRSCHQQSWPGTRRTGRASPRATGAGSSRRSTSRAGSSTVERRFTLNTTLGFLRGSRAGASFGWPGRPTSR